MESRPIDARVLQDHTEWIRRLARSLVRDEHTADDLAQETCLAALRRPPDDGRPLRPWLGHVLRNFVRQRVRLDGRNGRGAEDREADERLPSAAELAERAELSSKLVRAVIGLPEPQRSTVLLRYYEGLTSSEIARRKRLPPATVRSRLKRGLDQLRIRLDEVEGDRSAWMGALVPLLHASDWTQGALAVKWNSKVTVALTLAVLGGLASAPLLWPASPESPDDPGADAAVKLVAPEDNEEPETAAVTAPLRDERRTEIAAAPVPAEAPAPAASLSVRLSDAATGEAVPFFAIGLRQGELYEQVVTDEDGKLESETAFLLGALALSYDDHAGVPRNVELETGSSVLTRESVETIEFDPDAPHHELAIAVGPTYFFDLRGAPQLDPQQCSAAILALDDGWRDFLRLTTTTPLREGETPWTRFAKLPTGMLSRQGPWRIEVRSEDGYWIGEAQIESITGVHERAVPINLTEAGRFRGSVFDEAGSALEGVSVSLSGPGSPVSTQSDEDGACEIEWLSPGTYRLTANSPRHRAFETEILVEPGTETALAMSVERLPQAGAIRGVLTSASGTYASEVLITLTPNGGGQPMRTSPRWEDIGGNMEGAFEFSDVPEGEYTVSVHSFLDKFPWSPAEVVVRAPADGLELFCEDDTPTSDLAFRVVDADTGEELERFDLHYVSGGGVHMGIDGLRPYAPAVADHPDDGELQWSVSAEGYAPAFGDLTDFGELASGVRIAEVILHRGWSTQFLVSDATTGAALPGAEIVIAGVVIATTDASGVARPRAASAPEQIDVRFDDWTVVSGDPSDASGDERSLFRRIGLAPPR